MKRKLSAPGGGQLPDCRTIAWDGRTCQVTGFEPATNGLWHLIDADIVPAGRIMARPLPPPYARWHKELSSRFHIIPRQSSMRKREAALGCD
jgi:hypothetical protein